MLWLSETEAHWLSRPETAVLALKQRVGEGEPDAKALAASEGLWGRDAVALGHAEMQPEAEVVREVLWLTEAEGEKLSRLAAGEEEPKKLGEAVLQRLALGKPEMVDKPETVAVIDAVGTVDGVA